MRVEELFADRPRRIPSFYRRFNEKIWFSETCWLWMGSRINTGYGEATVELEHERYRFLPHRVMFEAWREPIPSGLTIDHLCRVPLCVRPSHLEVVTLAENTRRQMAALNGSMPGVRCKRGHVGEYRTDPRSGSQYCKGCARENAKRYYHERKGTGR